MLTIIVLIPVFILLIKRTTKYRSSNACTFVFNDKIDLAVLIHQNREGIKYEQKAVNVDIERQLELRQIMP